MTTIIFVVLTAILTLAGPHLVTTTDPAKQDVFRVIGQGIRILGAALVVLLLASTSYVFVGKDETGHRVKIFIGGNLARGAIIATNGEKGPQAEIMPPGFHFEPFLNILYDVTMMDVVDITEGSYGYVLARDGQALRPDQTFADAFAPGEAAMMVSEAAYFLTHGGQKGPQTSVLTPGRYRLNLFLWEVKTGAATEIPKGFVGVIKSNVHSRVDYGNLKTDKPDGCSPVHDVGDPGGALAVPLVPVGCIGVWEHALNPGRYYVNREAYTVTLVDTRVQTWEYRGGFTRRQIDLTVDQEGRITQRENSENVAVPRDAADEAVFLKIEGWTVAQQLRVLVQVTPDKAPFVVASVGGLQEIEDRIMSPAVQSVVRNVAGGNIRIETPILDENGDPVVDDAGKPELKVTIRPTQVLDVIVNRPALEDSVEKIIRIEGSKAGVDIKEVRFLEPDLPPELLVARKREQLAQQLAKAYMQERGAQTPRVETERARATADQQRELVTAQIEVKRSEQFAIARANEGRGERDKLSLIAKGQKAQALILGEDRVVELRKFEFVVGRIFAFFENHPDVLTTALANAEKFVPERVFTIGGEAGSNNLAGAAGIIGDFLGPGSTTVKAE